jgi:hypothetical protein
MSILPLLADENSMPIAWLIAIIPGTATVSIVSQFIFNWWTKKKELEASKEERERKAKNEEEDRAIDHYERYNKRLEAEIARLGTLTEKQGKEIDSLRLGYYRSVSWIRHLEDRLTAAGQPFDKWEDIIATNPEVQPRQSRRKTRVDGETKAE